MIAAAVSKYSGSSSPPAPRPAARKKSGNRIVATEYRYAADVPTTTSVFMSATP